MSDINFTQIKYLNHDGLVSLWDKISNVFLRDSEVISALTTYGDGQIITQEEGIFIQKAKLDEITTLLNERIDELEAAQGTNIDNDTIINKEGLMQTDLLLSNDKDNHILNIVTGKGTTISSWDYTEFYNEAVKDGILENVSLIVIPDDEAGTGQEAGTYLKFIFNTAAGKTPLYVNVTDLIDVYTGSNYIEVVKTGDTSTINIKTTELVKYLATDDALGITSILTRLELTEDKIGQVEDLVKSLQEAWEKIDIEALIEQVQDNTANIESIYEYLKDVPNTPITYEEINALE